MKGKLLSRALLGLGLCLLVNSSSVHWPSRILAQGANQAQHADPQGWLGTGFTYQGHLTDGGSPANGSYDFQFTLYGTATEGSPLGSVAQDDVPVADSLFTLLLNFGGGVFTGEARYLEIGVRPGGSTGSYTALTPRQALTPVPYALALPGLWTQLSLTSPNLIGGYSGNSVEGVVGATIGGGGVDIAPNQIRWQGSWATIGGGCGNTASSYYTTIAGGQYNTTSASFATIGGGVGNRSSGAEATIAGGNGNLASGLAAVVGGGMSNTASADFATIAGGGRTDLGDASTGNFVTDNYGTVGGGGNNLAGDGNADPTDSAYATVGGGIHNSARGHASTVSGGANSAAIADYATVSGGLSNGAYAPYATIGGGNLSFAQGTYGTVGGGAMNYANGEAATVGGGMKNSAGGDSATVAGGRGNEAVADYATIAGGGPSDPDDYTTGNQVTDHYGTVGGGGNNQAGNANVDSADAAFATVGGGKDNVAGGERATVGGGEDNVADGGYATVGGGDGNQASGNCATVGGGYYSSASGSFSTVAGGYANAANGWHATVPGGYLNSASGNLSFAAGTRAQANHSGAFVWADSWGCDAVTGNCPLDFASTADNEFAVRATGGVRFVSAVDGNGNPGAGVVLPAGGGSWSSLSDRNAKANWLPVDGQAVLERLATVPVATWNYKAQDASVRHMGPSAQDFYAAFGLGEDDQHIATVDADGVALAAIQALYDRSQTLETEAASLRQQVTALQQQNLDLEARLSALEAERGVAAGPSGGRGTLGLLLSGLLGGLLVVGRSRALWLPPGGQL